ncbi:MAG TPA: tetratricopeptide repeat protein [Gemmatimonadales bacterium]|nr:tetratricopeptide repeat protein [Gemmatimonadales bacterium]
MTRTVQAKPMGLPHAVFLQRVADEPATSPEVRLGQGAFLALRFVDLLSPDREPPAPDVFRYQWAATERYCSELAGEGTEAAHLAGLVRATSEAHRSDDIRALAPALIAYALYLEQDAHFEEAEDVLLTLLRVGGERLAASDGTAAWMRVGRVRRLQADFDRADAAYAEAGRIAAAAGDRQSMLLSRIGQTNVLHFRGNLPEAERGWRGVLADAASGGFRTVEAQAEHGLGNVLARRGQPHEGAPHVWRAYELYEEEDGQLRSLNDLALILLSLGDVTGAETALKEVVRRERVPDNLANATIELMHCASFRRDRVGFERWRERALDHFEEALPNIRADYHLKVGIGLARFGNYNKAETQMQQALEIASAHGLHEVVFRIERIKSGLRGCEALEHSESTAAEPVIWTDQLREVSASLAALSA